MFHFIQTESFILFKNASFTIRCKITSFFYLGKRDGVLLLFYVREISKEIFVYKQFTLVHGRKKILSQIDKNTYKREKKGRGKRGTRDEG